MISNFTKKFIAGKNGVKKVLILFISFIILAEISFITLPTLFPDLFITKDAYAQKVNEKCVGEKDIPKCFGQKMAEISKKKGLIYSLDVLKGLQQINPEAKECHIIGHHLALAEVEKDPEKWIEIFRFINVSDCENGFLHGGLEGLARYDSDFIIDSDKIIEICNKIEEIRTSYVVSQGCAHAFGHILLGQNYEKEIEKAINKSVAECNILPIRFVRECNAGIFMESYTKENLHYHWNIPLTNWASAEYIDYQEDLCRKYEGLVATACWQEMGRLYSVVFQFDPNEVFKQCSKAPKWENTGYCYMKSANIFITSTNNDKEYLKSICEPLMINPEYHDACILGALSSLVSSNYLVSKAVTFCEVIDKNYKKKCFETLIRVLADEDRMKEETCDIFPAEYKSKCQEAPPTTPSV